MMKREQRETQSRRKNALTREAIIETSIAILDRDGEKGLTFQALSSRLETGAGAIYWHINDKDDLLAAACDAVLHPAIATIVDHESPAHAIRGLASSLFDLLDDHPWIGSTLTRFPTQIAMIRLLEHLGGHIRAVGVHQNQEWAAASTLLMYMLGVGSQNAANAQLAREQALERSHFLDEVASAWSQLSADQYPFVQSNAERMRTHDDRDDFLTGIDFILKGIIAAGIR